MKIPRFAFLPPPLFVTPPKVSDVKFRAHGHEWACAIASMGNAGEPGGVNVRVWPEEELEWTRGVADTVNIVCNPRVVNAKVGCKLFS